MMLLTLASLNVGAQECAPRLEACDEALTAAGGAIDSLLKLAQDQDELTRTLKESATSKQEAIEDLRAESKFWYRNPFITIPLGLVVGAATATILIKK